MSIGPMTPNQLLDSVAPFISHENQEWLREQAPALLMKLSMLRHLELLGSDGRAVFTLAKPGGALFTMPVAIGDPRVVQLGMADGPPHAPVPLSRSRPASYYWFRYLEESRTVYIQINRCEEDPALPFARFAHEALAAVAARKARRVVVDLRQNGGGNSEVIRPLERGLDHARLRGRIFVLVGPSTYSSALMNALQLRADAHATLVGEPMGEKPNTYGEIRSITLPNSQLRIWYTTKFFQQAPEGDPDEVRPDIPAAANLADDLAGRDPALDAALAAAVPAAR